MHPILVWLMVGAFVVALAHLGTRKRKLSAQEEREEQELLHQIDAGARLPDGRIACIICGELATHHVPMLGESLFTHLIPFRDLFAVAALYRAKIAYDLPQACCGVCHNALLSVINEQCAEFRRDNARHAAEQERRVAMLRSGGIHVQVKEQHERTRKTLTAAYERVSVIMVQPMTPQLPEARPIQDDDVVVSVRPQTTNGASADEPPVDATTN